MAYTLTDLAYLAGIIDGEGNFSLHRAPERRPGSKTCGYYWKATLRVTNTDRTLMVWLVEKFGGSFSTHKGKAAIKTIHQWKAHPTLLRELLPQLLPLMIIKQEHTQIMLGALDLLKRRTGGNRGRPGFPRPFGQELTDLRNRLIAINAFRHRTGKYAHLDQPSAL